MIMMKTKMDVADNTGAKIVGCIKILGSNTRFGYVGNIFIGNVRKAIPGGEIKQGDKVRGVIVRTKRHIHRKDGSYVRFDNNSCVLLDTENNPKGTRIFGAVPRELRKNFMKIISLAPEVV